MPKFTVREFENSGKWCVCVDGTPNPALGLFNTKEEAQTKARNEHLRTEVLSTVLDAKFEIPASDSYKTYTGCVAAIADSDDGVCSSFAQNIGKRTFVLHSSKASKHHGKDIINVKVKVKYENGKAIITVLTPDLSKWKGHAD